MKRQSKKEKEVIDKCKRDMEGMTSSQRMEYLRLNDTEKAKFVQKFRGECSIRYIAHENHIDKKIDKRINNEINDLKSSKSLLTKKEREKGLRTERIWIKGNPKISHECQYSNDLRNAAQYFERANYFKNRDLLKDKRKTCDKEFKINKKDRYIYHNELDKMKDMIEFVIDDNGVEKDKYNKFRDAYKSMTMACLSQQTLALVADSWEGYFEGLFGFLRGDPNYTGMPNIPGYGDKGGEYIVVIPNDRFRIISGQDIDKSWGGINKKVNTLAFEPGLSYLKLDGLETTLDEKTNLREIRIVPAGVGYWIEIVYKLKEDERKKELLRRLSESVASGQAGATRDQLQLGAACDLSQTCRTIKDKYGNEEIVKLDHNIVGGIDLGLRNIVTKGFVEIVDSANGDKYGKVIGNPIIFKGGILKSINQYYNKRRSDIQSIYEHQAWKLKRTLRHLEFQYNVKTKNSNIPKEVRDKLFKDIQSVKGELKKIRTGPALRKLEFKRKNKLQDVMHKYSRNVINDNIVNRSGTLVIGHNIGQKQSIELGNITNQNFVFVPFYKLIKMIRYKGDEVGINVIVREESHTSKCSVIDWETVEHHNIYMGKRIYKKNFSNGGLFKSKNEIIINSDVQGYLNIIRKEFPNIDKIDGIEGVRLHPVRVNPLC